MARISFEEARKLIRLNTYEEIANEYTKLISEAIDNRWKRIETEYKDSDLDPVDERTDELDMLRIFKYRMELMIICCLCETWEQDLYNYLKENKIIDTTDNNFCEIIKIYKNILNIDYEYYPKLKEMKKIVNSIKHGNGPSYEKLLKTLGTGVLADSNLGVLDGNGEAIMRKQREFDDNTLTSITLNYDGKIAEYHKAIVGFWEDVFKACDNN